MCERKDCWFTHEILISIKRDPGTIATAKQFISRPRKMSTNQTQLKPVSPTYSPNHVANYRWDPPSTHKTPSSEMTSSMNEAQDNFNHFNNNHYVPTQFQQSIHLTNEPVFSPLDVQNEPTQSNNNTNSVHHQFPTAHHENPFLTDTRRITENRIPPPMPPIIPYNIYPQLQQMPFPQYGTTRC